MRKLAEARDFFVNELIGRTPFVGIRLWLYERFGMKFEDRRSTTLMMYADILAPKGIEIGANTIIGRDCVLDGRAPLKIGRNVNIGGRTQFFTGSHDVHSPDFAASFTPITVEDHVWIAVSAVILPGVTIGRGAVVSAGTVVSRDLEPMGIYAGSPAQKIGERTSTLEYELGYRPSLI